MLIVSEYFSKTDGMDEGKQLIAAAIASDLGKVKELIEKNPDIITYQDEHTGLTVLHIFAVDCYYRGVEWLVTQPKCPFGTLDYFGRYPVQLAYTLGRRDIVKLMSDEMDRRFDIWEAGGDPDAVSQPKAPTTVVPFPRKPSLEP